MRKVEKEDEVKEKEHLIRIIDAMDKAGESRPVGLLINISADIINKDGTTDYNFVARYCKASIAFTYLVLKKSTICLIAKQSI